MIIRRYEDADGSAVRALFIRVNRELAPAALREQFESYIAQSLREEIDRIEAYYAEHDGTFWIAEDAGTQIGMYGLERVDRRSAELRRMYVAPEARRHGIARMMLDHTERTCRDAGFRVLTLSTSELQKAALGPLSRVRLPIDPRGGCLEPNQQDRRIRTAALPFREDTGPNSSGDTGAAALDARSGVYTRLGEGVTRVSLATSSRFATRET